MPKPKTPRYQELSAALGEYKSVFLYREADQRPAPKLSSFEGPARLLANKQPTNAWNSM